MFTTSDEGTLAFTEAELIDFLKRKVSSTWDKGQPYLISSIATDLKEEGTRYTEAIGEERPKAFVRRVQGPETFKVVEHPIHRAKVGLVPYDAPFEFESEFVSAVKDEIEAKINRKPRSEKVLVDFLRELSRLNDKDLEGLVIPVTTLLRLVRDR